MKPLKTIINLLDTKAGKIDQWFAKEWEGLTPLPYFSCDIRHSHFKMAIVDTNVFPGGFNNLCNSYTHKTAQAIKDYFKTYYPDVKKVALLAETHTRNKFYLFNVLKIQKLVEEAGLNCRVTMSLEHFPEDPIEIKLAEKEILEIYKPIRTTQDAQRTTQETLTLGKNFEANLILTNNDFSSGLPKEFESLQDQIIPHPHLGWHMRQKSEHFKILSEVIIRFAKEFEFDPWILSPMMESVEGVSADKFESLAPMIDQMIADIQRKYDEYGVTESPYVFIKNDSGTYGLGLVNVMSGAELLSFNRKKRNKLFSTKGGAQSERFFIQEGLPTADTYSGFPIEPVIYGIGKESVSGFFRIHENKNPYESLNAPGASYSCLCLHKLDEPHESDFIDCKSKEELVTGSLFLAKLAGLAAGVENLR